MPGQFHTIILLTGRLMITCLHNAVVYLLCNLFTADSEIN